MLVLIGHGSFDGVEYKFNLVGPDISGADLAALCDKVTSKRQLVINTTSASGGSVAALKKPGRAVVAATKSGTEKNATVFARYWVAALHDAATDADKNDAISAMEAFQYADRKTAEFYESQKRLATEHPAVRGHRESLSPCGCLPPIRARACCSLISRWFGWARCRRLPRTRRSGSCWPSERNSSGTIDTLKYQKAAMSEDDYKRQLTAALLELAKVQQDLDK